MTNKEWAKMFLTNWNRAVELWDDGRLFGSQIYSRDILKKQEEYARICCIWLLPNNFEEPHSVAYGIDRLAKNVNVR